MSAKLIITAKLQELRLRAGQPSARKLAASIGSISHTTVSYAFRGQLPGWANLQAIVKELGGDEVYFRELWAQVDNDSDDSDDSDLAKINALIGRELMRHRQAKGLTRPEAVALVTDPIAVNTLSCYETGIRPMTVARFLNLCQAIGTYAPDLLAAVLQQIGQTECPTCHRELDRVAGGGPDESGLHDV